jgi:ABC-type transport system involved in multi-copper enzyme maturation permease subunit
VKWEVRFYLRRISTWIYFGIFFAIAFLLMLAVAGAFGDLVALNPGGKVVANSPLTLASLMPAISLRATSITAALAGNALYRDYEAGIDPLIYTTPLGKTAFLGGRFVGSLIVNAIVLLGIGIGAAIAFATPWAHPDKLAAFRFAAYARPYLTHIYPNLIFTGAIFFSLVALTRQMLPNYVGGAVLIIGYLLSASLLTNLKNRWLAAMLDPFGQRATRVTTEYWTISEKNRDLVPLTGMLLTNRLIWSGVALAALIVAYRRFQFSYALGDRATVTPPAPVPPGPIILGAPVRLSDLPDVRREFGTRARLAQFSSIAVRSFWRIVRNRYFGVIVTAGLLYLIVAARVTGQIYGTTTWPVTYEMVEVLSGSFGIFLLVIIVLYAGELVWAERDSRIAGIYDAAPVGTTVTYLAKLAALCGMIGVLQLVMMIAGIVMQVSRGYYRFEIPLYLESLGMQYVDLILIAVLAFTVHVVVDNKYAGHFVVVLLLIGNGVQGYVGLEHNLFDYAADGGTMYSDMNRWGPYLHPFFWWKAYWLAFAVLLVVIVQMFWVRGSETDAPWRFRLARRRLAGRTRQMAIGAGTAFAGLGAFIFYNTNVLNIYRTRNGERDLRVTYEKRYKRYEAMPQPRIAAVTIAVDLYPERQGFEARGQYLLRNTTPQPIDTIVVAVNEDLRIQRLDFDRPSARVLADPPRNFYLYRLEKPLAAGDSAVMYFEITLEPRGFPNSIDFTGVAANGTFLENAQFMPGIGYSERPEISDDDARKRAKLPPKPRMKPPTDPTTLRTNYVAGDADWVHYDATVSTSADQIAITSGYLDSVWTKGDRRYSHYVLSAPIINLWAFQSARYAVKRDKWNDVDIEIDYHPDHKYNVDRMVDAIKASLDYYTSHFGPYQHKIVRIVEFPRYAAFAQSLPNTIPYSEAIGFIARVGDPQDIDYPFYVTAHEVAHQWWAHQVVGANAQGATMLSETLAQYSAMMVMEKQFGQPNMRRFLEYELDHYLLGRSTESRREMPLELVENQQYIHYNKGSVVMYALRDYIGEARVNAALRGFLTAWKFKGPPYPTSLELVDSLRAVTPDSLKYLIKDLFETITLYELKTDSIVVSDSAAGLYRVDVFGSTKKLRADSLGAEEEIPMDDWVDIGLFKNGDKKDTTVDKNGIPVYLRKHRLSKGPQHLTIVMSERPIRGGIDPLHKLIDRKVDDNTTGVYDRTKARQAAIALPPAKKKSP